MLLSALLCEKGDIDRNLAEHRRVLRVAQDAGCALALFPEMSLTGSVDPARNSERLVALDHPAVSTLVAASAEADVAAVFGIAEQTAGGPYITQVVAAGDRIAGVQRKRHLGEGEEAYLRADDDVIFDVAGTRFAIAICAEAGVDRPFEHAQAEGTGLVCFAAAPGLDGPRRTSEAEWRAGWDWWCGSALSDAGRHARERGLAIAIATQAGATVDEDFPGLAALVNPKGDVVARSLDWNAVDLVVEIP